MKGIQKYVSALVPALEELYILEDELDIHIE